MKFGKKFAEETLKEWRFYAVDYKEMKKSIKKMCDTPSNTDCQTSDTDEFFTILENSETKLAKFFLDKESWAASYLEQLDGRVQALRDSASTAVPGSPSSLGSEDSKSSLGIRETLTNSSPKGIEDLRLNLDSLAKREVQDDLAGEFKWLKEDYRRVGRSKHFQDFIYAKKSLVTFEREVGLLLDFLTMNRVAFQKILKKFDKRTKSSIQGEKLALIYARNEYFDGAKLTELRERANKLLDEVTSLKPELPRGWENRKVYTIGCFDLFHRGHQNVLLSLREFGYFIVAGIHDDASYFKLKNKYTIDNLETRMANVKPYVDQLFVIPSTDPLVYVKSMVSDQDIATGSCCYARGDDMLNFPGREWIESVMPVHFVPRTEACSSTLIRTIYHAKDSELRKKAAFAKTRYDGKPVDEEGNVLKLKC